MKFFNFKKWELLLLIGLFEIAFSLSLAPLLMSVFDSFGLVMLIVTLLMSIGVFFVCWGFIQVPKRTNRDR